MPAGGFAPSWTATEDDYLREHYPHRPAKEVAAHLGRSHGATSLRAQSLKIPSYHWAGKRSTRHDYFALIDTPTKAYILGLLAADGCVARRTGQLQICLVAKDRSAVELIRNEIAPDARLVDFESRTAPMVRFTVQSQRLAADLAVLGITPAKSLTLGWPTTLPEEFANSYVGGFFDGDGSLTFPEGRPRWAITSASVPFLESIQQWAFNQLGTWIGGPYRDKRHKASSIVATGRGQVQDLDAWIGEDVPGLARKRLGPGTG
jgi:hypothetical protein